MSQQLRTREEIGAYFEDTLKTRDLGRVANFASLAAEGITLQANDRAYHTGSGFACIYDGTYWITEHEYSHVVWPSSINTAGFTANPSVIQSSNRTDYSLYISRVSMMTVVNTTNTASNYWTLTLRSFPSVLNIHQFTTAADTVNVFTSHDGAPNLVVVVPIRQYLELNMAKTGSPGSIGLLCTVYYRLIIA